MYACVVRTIYLCNVYFDCLKFDRAIHNAETLYTYAPSEREVSSMEQISITHFPHPRAPASN